jgi:succinyl-CoA synthetase alpha subunit
VTLFFDRTPRVLVQGITGREGRMVASHMLAYGTEVHAGVTPGRAGEAVEGVPVFDTVSQAVAEAGGPFDVSIVYVPPLAALDAVADAVNAAIPLLLVVTENIPVHDSLRLLALARGRSASVIGPNSVGLIEPARRLKLGAIGGDNPDRAFVPGRVAVLSRSGGLTVEIGLQLRLAGLGVSHAISIGGDAMIGTSPAELYRRLQDDDGTDAIIYAGEPGTALEAELADEIAQTAMPKPLVALILGRFMEDFPKGAVFGHAGAVIGRADEAPSEKLRRLQEAGALVAETIEDALNLVRDTLKAEAVS